MPVTLVQDPAGAFPFDGDAAGFWPISFDRVAEGALEPVLAEYDVVIPADGLLEPPRLSGGARVALVCTRLDALERLVGFGDGFHIVFHPTMLARLDRHRALRATLVAARAMDYGHRIRAQDLAEEIGGPGLSADFKVAVIGRVLLYDLPSGSAIDFGMIGERGEEPA